VISAPSHHDRHLSPCRVRDERGQGLVEMALLLPVVLLLALGILELGRALHTRQAVTDAARAGARRAVVLDPSITVDSVYAGIVTELARQAIPTRAVRIEFDTFAPPAGHWRETGAMQTVYVRVQYRFGLLRPIVQAAIGKETIPIEALITMRNE
jgi:hypothetical protein